MMMYRKQSSSSFSGSLADREERSRSSLMRGMIAKTR